jgi:hypothetical protein
MIYVMYAMIMFWNWWRGVDDVNDRPVGNPKRRFDEYSSKFSLSKKPRISIQ